MDIPIASASGPLEFDAEVRVTLLENRIESPASQMTATVRVMNGWIRQIASSCNDDERTELFRQIHDLARKIKAIECADELDHHLD